MSLDFDEKRDFQRLQLNHPMKVTEQTTGRAHQGLGRDLSATGLSFYMESSLPEGALLEVAIDPAGQSAVLPFRAEVEVNRVDRENQGYLVATKILRML
ncbi:PilZ domain-containing protein [Ectothiorhodospira lacustris]|uniref:PilZ domain-containing protein n=1 Tax=Ectothiorhodospira lacustris TaxID=2899127 RepID=UPI001EE9162C|nr:PilZ domain-containing protein [Ectothiorhodospira lacustris]MCG5501243.1 PilZ domain-containing protein [Ectothiorhodospira lacustris]MCG5509483.1 PilZ domain-containing protein [Ectothiorhodospira lacustris]MCG5521537.1 PilZ domain-containing protein [Ectothiorhodospira lacustris]